MGRFGDALVKFYIFSILEVVKNVNWKKPTVWSTFGISK